MSRLWPGRVFLDVGTIFYVGPGGRAENHAHHAVQIVWSHDGPFDIDVGGRYLKRSAAIVPANHSHALDASHRRIGLLLVEAHGPAGTQLDAIARRDLGRDLTDVAKVRLPVGEALTSEAACVRRADVLTRLGTAPRTVEPSSVSRRAIEYIEATIDGMPRVADAAAKIGISATRLTHVFTKEIGIPFRRFVLWTRIKRAIAAAQGGEDLTAAAMSAGFSDGARFSKTFRSMFGLSPSLVVPVAEVTGDLWRRPG